MSDLYLFESHPYHSRARLLLLVHLMISPFWFFSCRRPKAMYARSWETVAKEIHATVSYNQWRLSKSPKCVGERFGSVRSLPPDTSPCSTAEDSGLAAAFHRTGYKTVTSLSPTIVRSTSYRTSTITLSPTGTRLSPLVTTTRIPSVVTFTSQATRRSTYYTTTCTTYQARQTKVSYPYYGSYRAQVPTGLIVIAAIAGLWYAIFIGVGIYLICCSKTAKRERLRKKGQGGFSQPQYQQNLQPQQYTPVPQDPLYAQSTSQYPPPSLSSYSGVQQNLNPLPQTGYTGYQNYNAPNFGGQAANQWNQNTPSASSFVSGSGPGYIPPGAAQPMIGGSPPPGTYAMMTSTTPSPPPGFQGPGSDPHRMLYTQQNDRLSAAVSLVHPYQQSPQEQPPLSSYPAPGPGPGPGPGYAQPYQTSSQTQLSGQYRGYAEPSTMNYGPGGRF